MDLFEGLELPSSETLDSIETLEAPAPAAPAALVLAEPRTAHPPAFNEHHVAQGSDEWHALRATCITASNFSVCRQWTGGLDERQQKFVDLVLAGEDQSEAARAAGYKAIPSAQSVKIALAGGKPGDFTAAGYTYARSIALASIGGVLPDPFETFYMKRGHELEPEIRKLHRVDLATTAGEEHRVIREVGFVTTPDGAFGASADSLVDDDGGSEYKAFLDPDKVWDIVMLGDWSSVMDQVQGGMWITGRKWWDMCLYVPGLMGCGLGYTRHRVLRDDNYIEAMESDLLRFQGLVQKMILQAQVASRRAMEIASAAI